MTKAKEVVYLLVIIGLGLYIILIAGGQENSIAHSSLNLRLSQPLYLRSVHSDSMIAVQQIHSKYYLIVYFTAHDCYSCLQEFQQWNRLAELYSGNRLEVIGVIPVSDTLQIFSRGIADSLRFALYTDDGRVRNALQIEQTPMKLLFGPSDRLRFIDGPRKDLYTQKLFFTAVQSIVGIPVSRTF